MRLTPLHHRCAGTNAHCNTFYKFAAVVYPDRTKFYFYGIKKPRNYLRIVRGLIEGLTSNSLPKRNMAQECFGYKYKTTFLNSKTFRKFTALK